MPEILAALLPDGAEGAAPLTFFLIRRLELDNHHFSSGANHVPWIQ